MLELSNLLPIADLLSVIAFAVTGALVASRKELDIVGFMWLSILTGVGGGTIRDLILDVPVFWLTHPAHIVACVVTAGMVYVACPKIESRYTLVLWFDALGLALVTVAGTAKGLDHGNGALVSIVMGVITGSAGGIIRDLVGREPSVILRREIYVTASVVGASAYVLVRELGVSVVNPAIVGFGATLIVRGLALYFNWSMPAYRRPGTDQRQKPFQDIE